MRSTTASPGTHRASSSTETVRAADSAASRMGADGRSPGCARASVTANTTSSASVTPASSITSFSPQPVYQGTVPSKRRPPRSSVARTWTREGERTCA